MGKKKDKLRAAEQGSVVGGAAAAPAPVKVPWAAIDANPLQFLVAPEPLPAFLSKTWERKPAVFRATPERRALFTGLAALPALLAWLRKAEAAGGGAPVFEFGVDVNAARYRDGERQSLAGEACDAATLAAMHGDGGCTLQVLQPQRWEDDAWRLAAALERQLGVLVGVNAYLTPPGAQGLAPHHDDIEAIVVQTAGTKAWRLYAPLAGFELPPGPSGDLPQEALGDPVLEVTLSPGDVLYMPRGTVHQAVALAPAAGSSKKNKEGGGSAHLTISTYQRTSWADLTRALLDGEAARATAEPECLPLEMRRGPPPGSLARHSLHELLGGGGGGAEVAAGWATALRVLADRLEAQPDIASVAVHDFTVDFHRHRLPPHPAQLAPAGPAPQLGDKVWFRAAGWASLLPATLPSGDGGGGSDEEDEEDEEMEDDEGGVEVKEEQGEEFVGEPGSSSDVDSEEIERALGVRDSLSDDDDDDDEDADDNEEEDDESDDDDSEGGKGEEVECVKLVTCLSNARETHMMRRGGGAAHDDSSDDESGSSEEEGEDGEDDEEEDEEHLDGERHIHVADGTCCRGDDDDVLDDVEVDGGPGVAGLQGVVFPMEAAQALGQVMRAEVPSSGVRVADLALEHDADKLRLAFALWAEGLIATVRAPKKAPPLQNGGAAAKKLAKHAEHAASGGRTAKKAKLQP